MWTKLLFLWSFGALMQAQDDPRDLLAQVSSNIMQTVKNLPRYMCTLTVDRVEYQPERTAQVPSCDERTAQKDTSYSLHASFSDRLRLDVGIAGAQEIYSWAGANHFDDQDLFALVPQGAMSTGSFSAFLSSIFEDSGATFSYNGDTSVDGRSLAEFGYRVPREKSHYVFGNRQQEAITAYDGTFLIDPKTLDLVRLTVRTSPLPEKVGSCRATTTLDYGRLRLYDSDFLLPTAARLRIVNIDGSEQDNRTGFSNCHEFVGQSTLTFDQQAAGPASTEAVRTPAASAFALPPGIPFKVVFMEPIDSATAAAGDQIHGKLVNAIRNGKSKILVPLGAVVAARIVKIQRFYGPPSSMLMAVKLETLDVGGMPLPLAASIYGMVRFEKGTGPARPSLELGSLDAIGDRRVAVFEFRKIPQNFVVKAGMESAWETIAP